MDPVSTGIGIVLGLAPMFSVCLEYFQYFKSAQSLSFDVELLIYKLDVEQERLIAWGEANGILKTIGEGRNPDLDVPSTKGLIERGLSSIQLLFRDSRKLQERYGLRAMDGNDLKAQDSKFLSTSSLQRFRNSYSKLTKATSNQKDPGVLLKTRWAIYDKEKFQVLLSDVKDLVDSLYKILPVSNKVRDKIVFEAMRSLVPDFRRLRLVETASEDGYPTWSEIASLMASASEAGTIDGRSVGQWVEELDNSPGTEVEAISDDRTHPNRDTTRLDLGFVRATLYFVFTSACSSDPLKEPCDDATLGSLSLRHDGPHFVAGQANSRYTSFGRRITMAIDPKSLFENLMLPLSSEFPEVQKLMLEACIPVAHVDVFCAPCACAIQTAIRLCKAESTPLISYRVKVDDRVPASCCANSSKIPRLESLLIKIQEQDAGLLEFPNVGDWVKYLDRVWIEQRIYELETRVYAGEDSDSDKRSVAELLHNLRTHCVILGEVDHCLWIFQTKPFPWTPRMAKANEIYQMKWHYDGTGWVRKFLGSFTPQNFRSQAASIGIPNTTRASGMPESSDSPPQSRGPQAASSASFSPTAKRQRTWEPSVARPSPPVSDINGIGSISSGRVPGSLSDYDNDVNDTELDAQ